MVTTSYTVVDNTLPEPDVRTLMYQVDKPKRYLLRFSTAATPRHRTKQYGLCALLINRACPTRIRRLKSLYVGSMGSGITQCLHCTPNRYVSNTKSKGPLPPPTTPLHRHHIYTHANPQPRKHTPEGRSESWEVPAAPSDGPSKRLARPPGWAGRLG